MHLATETVSLNCNTVSQSVISFRLIYSIEKIKQTLRIFHCLPYELPKIKKKKNHL
jgi:hypothetical protein